MATAPAAPPATGSTAPPPVPTPAPADGAPPTGTTPPVAAGATGVDGAQPIANPPPLAADAGDDDEPEDEPAPGGGDAEEGDDESSTTKPTVKVDTRNIKIDKFDGFVEKYDFDSNVSEWWEEIVDQVEDAQTLAGQTWSKKAKLTVLKMHLAGMEKRWFHRW